MSERLESMRMELRRGVLVLAVLAVLREAEYGYSLRKKLVAAGIDIEEGTLYPLVRRLEGYGLLTSEWREDEGRKKRYYAISDEGQSFLKTLGEEWAVLSRSVANVLEVQQ